MTVAKVDATVAEELSSEFAIGGFPTLLLIEVRSYGACDRQRTTFDSHASAHAHVRQMDNLRTGVLWHHCHSPPRPVLAVST